MRTAAEVEAATRDVDGWLGPREGRLLYALAAGADPQGWIVEIGSWQGKSTIWLAAGARSGRGARVAAIDPHRGTDLRSEGETTEPALRANLERAGVAADVEVVVATSADAEATWSRPVSLLWIDGDHSYEGALLDLDRWERHLLPDAAVAFHDTFTFPGPERVFRERIIRLARLFRFRVGGDHKRRPPFESCEYARSPRETIGARAARPVRDASPRLRPKHTRFCARLHGSCAPPQKLSGSLLFASPES